jgi:ABC-type nitrate/sulfonate/bicarbonate transport system substrate-binding protein
MEHRTAAHAPAKAHTQKPNAGARRQCNRSRQSKKIKIINMKKVSLFAFAVTIFMAIGCWDNSPKKIKVGYLPMVSSLAHFVAVEKGYYSEFGIEVEANSIKSSNQIAQDLVGNHIDAAIELSVVPLLKQLEKSPDAARVFSTSSITSENGFDGVVVKSNSIITDLAGLSGKKVGVFPGTTAKNSFAAIFKSKHPNLPLPIFVELDPPLHIQSLETGSVDALHAYEPSLTIGIVKQGFKKVYQSIYAEQLSPNPIGVAAINTKFMQNDPKSAKAFFKAIDKAIAFIKANPQEARQILAKATKLEINVADKMNLMPMSSSTAIDFKSLDSYLQILKDLGEISMLPKSETICINPKN